MQKQSSWCGFETCNINNTAKYIWLLLTENQFYCQRTLILFRSYRNLSTYIINYPFPSYTTLSQSSPQYYINPSSLPSLYHHKLFPSVFSHLFSAPPPFIIILCFLHYFSFSIIKWNEPICAGRLVWWGSPSLLRLVSKLGEPNFHKQKLAS